MTKISIFDKTYRIGHSGGKAQALPGLTDLRPVSVAQAMTYIQPSFLKIEMPAFMERDEHVRSQKRISINCKRNVINVAKVALTEELTLGNREVNC